MNFGADSSLGHGEAKWFGDLSDGVLTDWRRSELRSFETV